MNSKVILEILKKVLKDSAHPEQCNDDIQPSSRKRYDGDKLGQSPNDY